MSSQKLDNDDNSKQSEWFYRVREQKELHHHTKSAKQSKKRLLLIILLVIVAVTGLIFFLSGRDSKTQQVASAPVATQPPPPPPPPSETPLRDAKLEKLFEDWVETHPANEWAMSIIGLDGDMRFAKYMDEDVFASASIYKLLLMYPLFQNYTVEQAKNSSLNVFGTTRNLLECVSLMLKVSDNPCGHAVGSLVGWEKADEELSKLGLSNTTLSNPSGSLTSAGDTATFLKAMYNDRLFDKPTKQYIMDTLYQQTWRDGIVAGCPDCKVANKTGDLGVRHDAAIVEYDGGAYVLVIFSDGASYAQIAQLTSRVHQQMSQGN